MKIELIINYINFLSPLMAHVEVSKLSQQEVAELACTYAALILHDDEQDITGTTLITQETRSENSSQQQESRSSPIGPRSSLRPSREKTSVPFLTSEALLQKHPQLPQLLPKKMTKKMTKSMKRKEAKSNKRRKTPQPLPPLPQLKKKKRSIWATCLADCGSDE